MQDFIFYLKLGWEHIISWDALDHQLFILALVAVYAVNDWKKILILITAFTTGHSVTLALSVFNLFQISSTWVEFLIPVTIAITAADNLLMKNRRRSLMKVNYNLALLFGLIHGLGFANTVRVTLASDQHIGIPLLGFNIGLEIGQIVVVLAIMLIFYLLTVKLRLSRKYWITGISAITLLWSLIIAVGRIPFA